MLLPLTKSRQEDLARELSAYVDSDSLSEIGLKERIDQLVSDGLQLDDSSIGEQELLHIACDNERVTEGIIRCILDYIPDIYIFHIVEDRDTPLHVVCGNKNATLNIVQLLVESSPDSLCHEDFGGWMPLHKLCWNSFLNDAISLEILKLFIDMYPEAVRTAANGRLPIHFAAGEGRKPPEFCSLLIGAYPGSERITTSDGWLPLHLACTYGTVATADCLLKLYPNGIHVASEDDGLYPIHYAIGRSSSLDEGEPETAAEMVDTLLSRVPDIASQEIHGQLPLLWACQQTKQSNLHVGLKVIRLLYDVYPEAIIVDGKAEALLGENRRINEEIKDFVRSQLTYARQASNLNFMTSTYEHGRLPLHIALHKNAALGCIKLLVKGNPGAIKASDKTGSLPLHLACQHHESASVVQYLLDLDSTTLQAVDDNGNTPLHYACRGSKYNTIALLVEQYHAAAASTINVNKQLPFHLLLEIETESIGHMQSIYLLLKENPEMVMNVI